MNSTRPELAVVMPAFNAERTVADTLSRLSRQVKNLPAMTVILVNDGSSDATEKIAVKAAREIGLSLSVINHGANRGYGAAQKTGFKKSLSIGCKYHALLHSDGQYSPEEMPMLLESLIKNEADVAVGSKMISGRALLEGMPLLRYIGSRFISSVENLVFGLNLAEYHSGYAAYSEKVLTAVEFETLTDKFHFDGEMLLCSAKLGMRVKELPISASYQRGSSSLSPLPYLMEIAGVMVRYLRRGYFFQ
ncbi:MAG: glycosyltransferase family 2 protein [Elusimicrobia bacterium]|nr:glycosyltransferase family 2 protein [Elusimicrobiota bacterium]